MQHVPRRRGFTLVEMLVVIAIIVVLMAILFPVFNTVRRKQRETRCISNLHQLVMSLRQYKADHGRFPSAPFYDVTAGRYRGGFSDLYPDYIDSTDILLCPDDLVGKRLGAQASQAVYSSYNGLAPDAPANWTIQEVYYNYNGYRYTTTANPTSPVTGVGIDNAGDPLYADYLAVLNREYGPIGKRPNRDAPRLVNRGAPDNTIVSHCIHHRGTGSPSDQREFLARLGGDVDRNAKRSWMEEDPDGGGPKISPWIGQLK